MTSLSRASNDFPGIADIPAVLLVGGLGTRLRSVLPSTPKPLAPVGNKSFLELLVRQLQCQGIRRLIMCSGFLADQIELEFRDGSDWDVVIEYSKEQQPMGTAGALKLAQSRLGQSSEFLVMNGDSFMEIDFDRFLELHRKHGGLASMGVLAVKDSSRYGTVQVAAGGSVTGFSEKAGGNAPGLVNIGVYAFNREIFEYIPEGPVSLERDVFPRILSHGMYALEQSGMFIDIGIPEDYARAQVLWDQLCDRAFRKTGAEDR
jgi:NDP-sugar pyrophosphorylase family protein